jgi:hypothetical protein
VAPHSTFVAVWALLGVEILRRHATHVVALNADAVQNSLRFLRRRGVVRVCFR